MYLKGLGADVPVDPLRVRQYAKRACELGATRDCGVGKMLGRIDSMEAAPAPEIARLQKQRGDGRLDSCGVLGDAICSATSSCLKSGICSTSFGCASPITRKTGLTWRLAAIRPSRAPGFVQLVS
jgi:hypothetical protein